MSACNIILTADAAHMITDAASMENERQGIIAAIGSKVLVLPALRTAITSRGRVHAVTAIAREITHAAPTSTVELLARLSDMLFAARAISSAIWPGEGLRYWSTTLGVVSWCPDRDRPLGYILATDNDWVPAPYEPWSMQPVRYSVAPGAPGAGEIAQRPDFDPERDGRAILELQRRDPYAPPGGACYPRVGGFGEITTVTRQGVTKRGLCTWSDRIGEPITVAASLADAVSA